MSKGPMPVEGFDCIRRWEDVFDREMSPLLVQPRANLLPPLATMRAMVPHGKWKFVGSLTPTGGHRR